jgi:hypothetical protein
MVMAYFRPTPRRDVNGLLLTFALAAFDVAIIVIVALDAWRFWGPRG